MKKKFIYGLSLFIILLPSLMGVVHAQQISECDLEHIYKDTVWYDPCSSFNGGACSTTVAVDLSGNDNVQIAYNFFISQGLTPEQSAGIVGNLKYESGLITGKVQGDGVSNDPNDAGRLGWGIAQWTPGSNVFGIVRDAGISSPIYQIGTQLEMLWAQLTGKAGGYSETQAGIDVKNSKTVEDAVRAFEGDTQYGGHYGGFERPKDEQASVQDRINLAKEILNSFSSTVTTVPSSTGGSGGCSSVGPGQDTQYVNGFTVYSQYDPQWKDLPYASSNIGDSGCGPAAMAMIITALTGQQVTPDQTAAYAANQGLYEDGVGSSWNIGPVLASHWGLNARLVPADIANMSAAIQSGGLLIVVGRGALPFTPNGHFIVIRGVAADGNWLIGDSGHSDTSNQEWPPNQVLQGIQNNGSSGSIYAIYK